MTISDKVPGCDQEQRTYQNSAEARRTILVDGLGNTYSANIITTLPDVDINDISKGTQTNDVKVTLDGETSSVQLLDQIGAALDATYGGTYGAKVHVVGDGDKYCRGTIAEGSAADDEPVFIGAEDDSGDIQAVQMNAAKDVKVTLDSEVITVDATGQGDIPITLDSETVEVVQDTAADLNVTEASASAIKTAVEIIDNCISGSEAQVDIVTQPARDRLTDNVGVALQTDAMLSDTTALTPKFAKIDVATTGENTLVSAVADKKIRVLALFCIATDDVTIGFEDSDNTDLTGPAIPLTEFSGFVLPFNPVGWFETGVNKDLDIELSGDIAVDGCLTYIEV